LLEIGGGRGENSVGSWRGMKVCGDDLSQFDGDRDSDKRGDRK
jgi:hypothetical protein